MSATSHSDRSDVGHDALTASSLGSRASAWLAVGAAILALVLAPPGQGDVLPAGILGTVVEGQLEQLVAGSWRTASVGDLVADGARVRVPDGQVAIRTRVGMLALMSGARAVLRTERVELRTGSVLVEGADPIEVTAGTVTARGRGTWRVDAGTSPRVGVYNGGVSTEDVAGRSVSFGALEQIDVVEGALAAEALALRYLPDDMWDARLLADAIAVDRQVDALEASLRAQYGTSLQTASFYGDFARVDGAVSGALPSLARFREDGRFGPPAETLVALVVLELLAERAGLPDDAAVSRIGTLRRNGATWGLIVTSHDLGPDDFRAAIDTALQRRQKEIALGTAAPVERGTPTTAQPPASEDGTTPEPPPSDEDPSPPPPSDGPSPSEPPPPDDNLVEQLEDTTRETVDDVAELLEPVPGASETVDGVGDAVDSTLP